MTRARWSYGCTVFELSAKRYLMNPPFVKGDDTSETVKRWCQHHNLLIGTRQKGKAGAVQKRLYMMPLHTQHIVWDCCHPDPIMRALNLPEQMDKWNTAWNINAFYYRHPF
jgi:hypothetical protein